MQKNNFFHRLCPLLSLSSLHAFSIKASCFHIFHRVFNTYCTSHSFLAPICIALSLYTFRFCFPNFVSSFSHTSPLPYHGSVFLFLILAVLSRFILDMRPNSRKRPVQQNAAPVSRSCKMRFTLWAVPSAPAPAGRGRKWPCVRSGCLPGAG